MSDSAADIPLDEHIPELERLRKIERIAGSALQDIARFCSEPRAINTAMYAVKQCWGKTLTRARVPPAIPPPVPEIEEDDEREAGD